MNALRDWYLARAPRERAILAAGGAVAVMIVLWGFIFAPLRTGTAELSESIEAKSRLLIDVQRAAALAPADAPSTGSAGGQSLVVLVDSTAQSHGLSDAITRSRPDGPNGINVTFQNASFDELVSWLVALESTHGVRVESATVNGTRAAGLVNGQLSLRRL